MKEYAAYLLAADSEMAPINNWCRNNPTFWKEGNILVCNSTRALRTKFENTVGITEPFIISDTPLPVDTWANILSLAVEGYSSAELCRKMLALVPEGCKACPRVIMEITQFFHITDRLRQVCPLDDTVLKSYTLSAHRTKVFRQWLADVAKAVSKKSKTPVGWFEDGRPV